MEQQYLIDTNVAIAYLNNTLPEDISRVIEVNGSNISVITRMELLVWRNASAEHPAILSEFISASQVINLEEAIILKTIEIRKTYGLKLPDAIIAATAIVYNQKLISANDADFKRIDGFDFINPFALR